MTLRHDAQDFSTVSELDVLCARDTCGVAARGLQISEKFFSAPRWAGEDPTSLSLLPCQCFVTTLDIPLDTPEAHSGTVRSSWP